jgi:hypothetical protein
MKDAIAAVDHETDLERRLVVCHDSIGWRQVGVALLLPPVLLGREEVVQGIEDEKAVGKSITESLFGLGVGVTRNKGIPGNPGGTEEAGAIPSDVLKNVTVLCRPVRHRPKARDMHFQWHFRLFRWRLLRASGWPLSCSLMAGAVVPRFGEESLPVRFLALAANKLVVGAAVLEAVRGRRKICVRE